MRTGIDRRAMAALSAGHLATDFANGAVPALLPFLVREFDLSYTFAALVMLAWAISSSVVQPLFGLWSDRRGAAWLLPVGLAAGAVGIGLAATAPDYRLVLAFVTVCGLGTAAYHPEGSKFAAYASGARRASGMALFSIGGNVGYALGPIAATAVVLAYGLDAGFLLALPGLALAAVLLAVLPFLRGFAPDARTARERAGEDRPRAMALLLAVVACRNIAWFGLITFVPLLELANGRSESYGNRVLSAMLLAGAAGTLLLGPAADRFGRRPVLLASVFATGPLIVFYLAVGGVAGAVALTVVGACVIGTFGVTMVMSQEYLPNHIGMATGLTIGLGIGLGGVAAVGVGAVGDAIGLRAALGISAAAAFLAAIVATRLEPSRVRTHLTPEVATP
jgi:MFS transporter, FSR family, fosmidomycin resistance protein